MGMSTEVSEAGKKNASFLIAVAHSYKTKNSFSLLQPQKSRSWSRLKTWSGIF